MSIQRKNIADLEKEITQALIRSAQLAREDAIKHDTSIVIMVEGKVVEVTAEELKKAGCAGKS